MHKDDCKVGIRIEGEFLFEWKVDVKFPKVCQRKM